MAEENKNLIVDGSSSSESETNPSVSPSTSSKLGIESKTDDQKVETAVQDPTKPKVVFRSFMPTMVPEAPIQAVPVVDTPTHQEAYDAVYKSFDALWKKRYYLLLLLVIIYIATLVPLYYEGELDTFQSWLNKITIILTGACAFVAFVYVAIFCKEYHKMSERIDAGKETMSNLLPTEAGSVSGPSTEAGSVSGPSTEAGLVSGPSIEAGSVAGLSSATETAPPSPTDAAAEEEEIDLAVRHRHVSGEIRESTV